MSNNYSRTKVTGRMLAQMLGVSPATISNALNGHDDRVSPETKRRILEAAKRYGYLPPQRAKQARSASGVIAFVVLSENLNDWFLGNLSGIADICRKRGVALMQMLFPAWDREYFEEVLQRTNPMGALYICTPGHPMIEGFARFGIPTVAIDCYDDKTQWNAVHLDNYGGAYDATSYLLESGHRQIGLLSGGDEWPSGVYRKRGFIQALKDWGIPFDQRLVYNGHFTQFGGYLGAKSLLETNPSLSAIFAVSDEMALGAIRALYDLGLKVPDDVSVVGFDGICVGQNLDPPLTTVETDPYAVGTNACAMLLGMLESHSEHAAKVQVGVKLVVRGTTRSLERVSTSQGGDESS
ncbi:MAG: hypothetical protein AA931_06000 [Peptococcaceae bacterium 1109]|nr:MAG: hypothetical protein AA931_06000 [Peptococcaceae bacterium 1109]